MNQVEFYEAKLKFETDSWDLSEAVKNGDNIVVVDTRNKDAFEIEHIPGAICFPHRTMSPETTAYLDKHKVYITYCDGIGCNASTKGALKLTSLGFTVKELLGGLDWWHRDGYETHGKNATAGKSEKCAC